MRSALLGGGLLRLLLLRFGALGEDHRDAAHRVVLGQILKDQAQLPVLQHLHMIFGRFGVLGQDLRDLLCGHAEVLGHLMHSVFVSDTTQIKPPPSQLLAPRSRRAVFLLSAGRLPASLALLYRPRVFIPCAGVSSLPAVYPWAGGRSVPYRPGRGVPPDTPAAADAGVPARGPVLRCRRLRRRVGRFRRLAAVNAVPTLPQVLLVL